MLTICFAMRAFLYRYKSYQQILFTFVDFDKQNLASIYLISLIIIFVVFIFFLPHPFSAD